MSYKLYADGQCVEEIFSIHELREKAGYDKVDDSKKEKKICNCPNCGAPITNYICEYCGTILDPVRARQVDHEMNERYQKLLDKISELELARVQTAQELQMQHMVYMLRDNLRNAAQVSEADRLWLQAQNCICDTRTSINSDLANLQSNLYTGFYY